MTMLCGKVTVPDTSGDMSAKALPVVSIGGVTEGSIAIANNSGESLEIVSGYLSFTVPPGGGPVWIFVDPHVDPDDDGTWPTAQHVVDNGTAIQDGIPISIQDPGGAPSLPDLRKYFAAKTGAGAGDLRVIS